ncbi:MAG: sugar ABC transporter ATP-binding protein [Clostridia bacterium]|nr:sugar ABC transporter ATP-binding protein [Clostridia bacterium]
MLRRCALSNNTDYVLELENVSKSFPGVQALKDVSLKVRKGTVHALMGENGAGKSTLMKIVVGVYTADPGGTIKIDGEIANYRNIGASIKHGVSMIFQELNPIPYMTVAENIYLNREPHKGLFVDFKQMIADTQALFDSLGIDNISPSEKVYQLTVAKKQMVEIAKAISYNSKLIIMDEPTSAITDKEVDHLFRMVRTLKKEKNVAFVFITHKMDEVFQITDEITVLRDGQYVGTDLAVNSSRDKLIAWMVGREITQMFPKEEAQIGEVIMSCRGLTRNGVFKDVSFDLKRGEILGFAGLMGAGRTEVMEALFGYTKLDAGEIFIHGKKVNITMPRDALKYHMALLTEDRKGTGCFLPLSIRDNMTVASIGDYTKGGFIRKQAMEKVCLEQKEKLAIKTPSMNQLIKNLSGGNQQKVLVARWLMTNPEILIVDEPTRGIDVGAKAEIHRLLSMMAKEGRAIIMISSELPEVMGMSDRIMVMHEGKITGEVSRKDANQTLIMQFATNTYVS